MLDVMPVFRVVVCRLLFQFEPASFAEGLRPFLEIKLHARLKTNYFIKESLRFKCATRGYSNSFMGSAWRGSLVVASGGLAYDGFAEAVDTKQTDSSQRSLQASRTHKARSMLRAGSTSTLNLPCQLTHIT